MGDGSSRTPMMINHNPSSLGSNQTSHGRPTPHPSLIAPGRRQHTLPQASTTTTIREIISTESSDTSTSVIIGGAIGGVSNVQSPYTRSPPKNRNSTPNPVVTTDTRIHRTRPSPHTRVSTTKAVTYSTRTTDNKGTTTTIREIISTESSDASTSVIIGGAIGGVSVIAIVGILIMFLLYRKRPRDDDYKRPMCCCGSSGGDSTNSNHGNTTPVQAEMTRQRPNPNEAVHSRTGPNAYDGASFRQDDDSSHFYETVPSRGMSSRSLGYNQLNLPRMNPQDPISGTNIRTGGDETNETNHEYLQLVESDGAYNHITNHSPNRVNGLYDHSGNMRENNYDVLQNENSLREVTLTSDAQKTQVPAVSVRISNDDVRFPRETSCYQQYHTLELNQS